MKFLKRHQLLDASFLAPFPPAGFCNDEEFFDETGLRFRVRLSSREEYKRAELALPALCFRSQSLVILTVARVRADRSIDHAIGALDFTSTSDEIGARLFHEWASADVVDLKRGRR